MTARELNRHNRRELAAMARESGISGWHDMRKRDLVAALVEVQKGRPGSANGGGGHLEQFGLPSRARIRHAAGPLSRIPARELCPDQLTVRWLGGGWIGLTWSLSARSIEQARAAFGPAAWAGRYYAIRLIQLESDDGAGDIPRVVAEQVLEGAEDRWFLRADSVRGRFAVQLGFGTRGGRFRAVLRSGPIDFRSARPETVVAEPAGGPSYADHAGLLSLTGCGQTAGPCGEFEKFEFNLSAEVLLEGRVTPGSRLKCLNETVEVDQHGEFHVCVPLPNGRQVIHLEAVTPDGAEQRTTVFAVERNTRQLEPRRLDDADSEDWSE